MNSDDQSNVSGATAAVGADENSLAGPRSAVGTTEMSEVTREHVTGAQKEFEVRPRFPCFFRDDFFPEMFFLFKFDAILFFCLTHLANKNNCVCFF